MSRIKIALPDSFSFSTLIPIRITDLNYGGHLGNDAVFSLLHEVRMQFLSSYGYSEMDVEGTSLIMADAAVEFKGEGFYGDVIRAYVTAADFSKLGFSIYYKLVKGEEEEAVAFAKTGMICFNYTEKKIAPLPPQAFASLRALNA